MVDPALHVVARAQSGLMLFDTWQEAGLLWQRLCVAVPDLLGMVLLPQRVDLVCQRYRPERFAAALRGPRGSSGAGSAAHAPLPAPMDVASARLVRRTLCSLYLDPVEQGLAASPLAWVFSTAREAAGLGLGALADVVPVDLCDDLGERDLRPAAHPDLGALAAAWSALHRQEPAVLRADCAAGRGFVSLLRPSDQRRAGALVPLWRVDTGPCGVPADGPQQQQSGVLYRVAGDQRFPALGGPLPGRTLAA